MEEAFDFSLVFMREVNPRDINMEMISVCRWDLSMWNWMTSSSEQY